MLLVIQSHSRKGWEAGGAREWGLECPHCPACLFWPLECPKRRGHMLSPMKQTCKDRDPARINSNGHTIPFISNKKEP